MSDYLLKGLKEVHQEIFKGKDGQPLIPFDRFCRRYVKNMRRAGVLFEMILGKPPDRMKYLCGWRNMIVNYMTALARGEDEERR